MEFVFAVEFAGIRAKRYGWGEIIVAVELVCVVFHCGGWFSVLPIWV
ncbi:hypothetical protein [Bartonella rattimassiliensis]|uniref:Uncharacterized protein n=1 Tax=Bartonella rattimassiliensis 15908 TaxID=1094556 RepID=J0QQ22_9HYPH|nr:hypothetical protein [Bartonella rattimassiliensis]EJF87851.1 hypothetical protein MCY_00054 [Bartonella rattimassiliensis 15908]